MYRIFSGSWGKKTIKYLGFFYCCCYQIRCSTDITPIFQYKPSPDPSFVPFHLGLLLIFKIKQCYEQLCGERFKMVTSNVS